MKIQNRDVFEQIGNLFYAVAVEQCVKPLEAGELKLLISREWLPRNAEHNSSIVSEETHFILMTMDTLQAGEVSGRDAFNQFAKFYSAHQDAFTVELKNHIEHMVEEITKIFKADHPSDNAKVLALKKLFSGSQVSV